MNKNIQYPRFISNTPCKEDLFEGKSHQKIAMSISNLLQSNENCNVIGIDGGWGSGKSNLVELVKGCLENNAGTKGKYKFFIYDAWGHQEDLQRRSILEELTDYLTYENKGILNTNKWRQKLKDLLAKKREIETTTIPKLSCGIILTALAVIITPILDRLTAPMNSKVWKLVIMSIPLILLLFLMLSMIVKNLCNFYKAHGFWWCVKLSMNEAFSIYADKKREDTTFETISEDEPSSREFKLWMHEIDTDIQGNILIVVFDNMDRLPKQKVQELWSAIHTFFADEKYNNIRVIVPFDREHIKSAFKNEDIYKSVPENKDEQKGNAEATCFGDDFINKTFNVVYRVSPPTMSNWKVYFQMQWQEAFGDGMSADSDVTQIYDLLTAEQTPRRIIAFINEFVSIKQLTSEEKIPDKYIALFILGKSKIIANPMSEILQPTYLGALDFMYKDDKNLPKYMSALYYQLPVDKALDIIYTEHIKQVLDNNKGDELINVTKALSKFPLLLDNAITKVSNTANAVLALNRCFTEENEHTRKVWDCVYKKVGRCEDTLQEYQKILLQKISDKERFLERIVGEFRNSPKFTAIEYYNSIKQLGELENTDPYKYLSNKEVEPVSFVEFVEQAKDEYARYKIICKQEKLDEFLAGLDIEHLKTLAVIPYIKDEYEMSNYITYLHELIDRNSNNKDNIKILYTRLKEVERPTTKKIADNLIYNYLVNTKNTDDFYYDLLCMGISGLNNFYNHYHPALPTTNTEDAFVEKVAERIEYYMNYDAILLNIETMDFPLYKEVAKKLTLKEFRSSNINILNVLQKYDTIIEALKLEPIDFIKRLNSCENSAHTAINSKNISSIPTQFFEDIVGMDDALSMHCISMAKEYLESISADNWKKAITQASKDYKLLMILRLKIQNAFDAFKDILVEYAKGTCSALTKERCKSIIELVKNNNRSLLNAFNGVRDCFCDGQITITNDLFDFFGEWLLEYSKLEDKPSALRTIFISSVLEKPENISLLIKYQDKMIKIVDNAGEESEDFKEKIRSLLSVKYKDNDDFANFANAIGVSGTQSRIEGSASN